MNCRKGRTNGSITKMAHKPSTTEGMAASSSTITPITSRQRRGMRFSVMKMAVPIPSGTAITSAMIEDTKVP